MTTFAAFTSWVQLIDHVRAEYRLYYQAPMDYRPVLITVVIRKDGNLRVTSPYTDVDPFTADIKHLDRFRRIGPEVQS